MHNKVSETHPTILIFASVVIGMIIYNVLKNFLITAVQRLRACRRDTVESAEVPPTPEETRNLHRSKREERKDVELILVGT